MNTTSNDTTKWPDELTEHKSFDKDIILFDVKQIPYFNHPLKKEKATIIILKEGKMEVAIDLRMYTLEAPCIVSISWGQILQYFYASDDLSTVTITMSEQFVRDLQMEAQQVLPFFVFRREQAHIPLKNNELDILMNYYSLLQTAINQGDNLLHKEAVKFLTKSLLYNVLAFAEPYTTYDVTKKKSRKESICEEFMRLIPQYYRKERSLDFYAKKMCLSPKHLSEVIKNAFQRSANSLIDSYVCLEARALLKSTDMTIQQISDELNFPSQSYFGKYFKRLTGISPKEYREK